MSTFLFDKIIFGPIQSRRLGLSLGINLMVPSAKHCNFDCIYCECGWNKDNPGGAFNSEFSVISRLEQKLIAMKQEGKLPDTITFAGNGEPTMHPEFDRIIAKTIDLRNKLCPGCKISVLSNGTMIDRPAVRAALKTVDRNILKIDSLIPETIALINQPLNVRTPEQTVELMELFEGKLIIQTMFLRGTYNGQTIDNTTEPEITAWLDALRRIAPQEVMIYSIDRDTPAQGLIKIEKAELETIAKMVKEIGIEASVS